MSQKSVESIRNQLETTGHDAHASSQASSQASSKLSLLRDRAHVPPSWQRHLSPPDEQRAEMKEAVGRHYCPISSSTSLPILSPLYLSPLTFFQ
eukprot:scaffold8956_cov67-Skeletonema_dohrnii-CCMP3373.AAC.2